MSGKTSLRRLETEPRCARKTVTGLDGVRWHALLSSRMLLNGIAAALPSAINKASLGGRRSSQGQPIGTPNLGPFCPAAPQAKQFCQNVQYEIISSEITVAARHNFPVPRGNCARTGRVALWTLSLPRISVLFLGDLGQSRYRTRSVLLENRGAPLAPCRTPRERLGYVHALSKVIRVFDEASWRPNADREAKRAAALYPFAHAGIGRPALLRRNEGRPRPEVEIRHPPAHHGPCGARLYPPPAPSRPRHRGHPPARKCQRSGARLAPAGRLPAERHRGQPGSRSQPPAVDRHRRPHGLGARHGPHRGRHAHQRHPEPQPRHRLPTRPAHQRRALRARSEGRLR